MYKCTLLFVFSALLPGCHRLFEPCFTDGMDDTTCAVVVDEVWVDNESTPNTEPMAESPPVGPNIVVSLRQDLVQLEVAPGTDVTLVCVDVTVNNVITHVVEMNGWVRSDEVDIEQLGLTMTGFEWFVDLSPTGENGGFSFDTADNAVLEPGTTATFCVVANQVLEPGVQRTCISDLLLQDLRTGEQSPFDLEQELCTTVGINEPATVSVSLSVDMPFMVTPGFDRQLACFDFEARGGAVSLDHLFGRILTPPEQVGQPENIRLFVRHDPRLVSQGELDGENFSFDIAEGDLTIADLARKTVCIRADVVENGHYMTCLNGFEFTDLTTGEQSTVQLGTDDEPIPRHWIIVE